MDFVVRERLIRCRCSGTLLSPPKPIFFGQLRFFLLQHRDYPLHDIPARRLFQLRLIGTQLRIDGKPRRSRLRSQQVTVTPVGGVWTPPIQSTRRTAWKRSWGGFDNWRRAKCTVDGTKIKANASKHKAMSYQRMGQREAELQAEVDGWLKSAEAADAAEDKAFGADRRGDEMPDWVANKQARLAKIREAKAELEAEARGKAAADTAREQAARENDDDTPPRKPPPAAPEPKAQRNFTDPESRILKTKDGYIQGYNAQAAVDAQAQIIVAQTLSNSGNDQAQFAPLLDAIKATFKRNPDEVSADAGYCSAANLRTLSRRRIKGYIATARQKHGSKSATAKRSAKPGSLLARMTTRLRRAGHRSRYRLRKQVVEPVYGQIKEARGFRRFLLRGIEKVKAEWAMICTAHNLRKLALAA